MNQTNNTEAPNQSNDTQKSVMDTSLFESLMAKNTTVLSPSTLEKNNSSSLQLRANKELNFDIFTKIIGLEIWGSPVTLLLSQWPMPSSIEKYLPENQLLSIPKELALITLSTAYDDLLTELSNILSTDINICQYLPFNDNVFAQEKELYHNNSLPFTITLDDGLIVEACLLVDERTMEQLSAYISQVSNSKIISLHQVISPFYLEYGHSFLTLAEIDSIEAGDILMMDVSIDASHNQLRLRFSSNQTFMAEKQVDSSAYQIIEVLSDTNSISDVTDATAQVKLSFDLDKTTITLDEMEKIGLGYTLDLMPDYNKGLKIRYNNQKVGKGELVKIGERVGVRITQLEIT